MLQWILGVLRIKLVFQKRLPVLALMSAQAITCPLLPCTVTFCAALPEEFSQELEAGQQCQKVKLQEQPQIARGESVGPTPPFLNSASLLRGLFYTAIR